MKEKQQKAFNAVITVSLLNFYKIGLITLKKLASDSIDIIAKIAAYPEFKICASTQSIADLHEMTYILSTLALKYYLLTLHAGHYHIG